MQRHKPINFKNIATYHLDNNQEETWGLYCNTVGCQTTEPGEVFPNLKHPEVYFFDVEEGRTLNEYHLVFVMEGEGFLKTKTMPLTKVTKGDVFLINPGEWHTYYPNPETGWKEYWIGFEGSQFDTVVKAMHKRHEATVSNMGLNATIEGVILNMIQVSHDLKDGYQVYLISAILHIFGILHYKMTNLNESVNPIIEKINTAREIIRNDIKAEISPEQVAERLNISYSLFRRVFKGYSGYSPVQYQMEARLKRAEELLTTTNLPISMIASELGFTDTAQFSTFFKKRQNITARDYRNRNRKEFL